jgi:hypothetical protein
VYDVGGDTRVTVLYVSKSYGGQHTFGVLSYVRPHCDFLRKLATDVSLPRVNNRLYKVEQDINSIQVPGVLFGVRHSEYAAQRNDRKLFLANRCVDGDNKSWC